MANLEISVEEMERERVARFGNSKPNPMMFVDTRLPEHARDLFSVIGPGVSEDPSTRPSITDSHGFNIAYVGAEPGCGAALHNHVTVEVFIPFSGQWTIYWGDEGENEIQVGPLDCFSVPPGVMRGFRNDGDEYAHMVAVVGGDDNGKVEWAQSVLDRAGETGLRLDEDGNLVVEPAE
ncbi:MAG: cupin domain-containing protein [Alphaproteobacteria bacterium]|nr:cupin domain-containing protein [Alphaproteobacteria bacterium]